MGKNKKKHPRFTAKVYDTNFLLLLTELYRVVLIVFHLA